MRPVTPPVFNQSVVEKLLSGIDEPRNASLLKVGYFLQRKQPELPTGEGYAMVKAAAQAEPVGTKRWFWLENLLGFAAFRVAEADPQDGFDAYNAVFAHASDAAKVEAQYPFRQAITEYVAVSSTRFRNLNLFSDPRTRDTLLKAWTANAVAVRQPQKPGERNAEPDWKRAVELTHSAEALLPYVEKTLDDASIPKNFGLLSASAAVLATPNPKRAVVVMQQAKAVLPRLNGALDLNQAARFYGSLVQLLVDQNRLPEAVAEQQEFVKLTGRGQGDLLMLYKKSGDKNALQALLQELSAPTANEREINRAASALTTFGRNPKAPDAKADGQAATLLETYLAPDRTRVIDEELQARLTLANIYLRQKQPVKAKAVLTFPMPPDPIPVRLKNSLENLEQARQRVDKALTP